MRAFQPDGMDLRMDGGTYGRKISPVYKTSSPTEATAQKEEEIKVGEDIKKKNMKKKSRISNNH